MGFFHALWDWMADYGWWIFAISATMFAGTLIFLPVAVAFLPPDYFTCPRRKFTLSLWGRVLVVAKNLLGLTFLLMGLTMLVLPGQGILTILIGVMLLDFPGKRAWELWLIRRPGVRHSIDWIRSRSGCPPLDYGENKRKSK